MTRPIQHPRFWIFAVAQLVAIVVVAIVWFYFRTRAYLAGPPDPDRYAWSWEYQWFVFAVFWLPATLVFTGILLAIEREWFLLRDRGSSTPNPLSRQDDD